MRTMQFLGFLLHLPAEAAVPELHTDLLESLFWSDRSCNTKGYPLTRIHLTPCSGQRLSRQSRNVRLACRSALHDRNPTPSTIDPTRRALWRCARQNVRCQFLRTLPFLGP